MKIGFVLDDSLDKADGVQQYILTLGHWFQHQGHEVHYLVGETKRHDVAHVHSLSRNIQVHFNQNRMSTPLPASKQRIRRLLQKEDFDVLHIQMPYSPYLAGRVIKAAPTATAVFGTFHIIPATGLEALAARSLRLLIWRSLRRIDHTFSVSPPAAIFARKSLGLKSDVVPNVVNASFFHDAKRLKKYEDGKVNIVFLGRLVERKGCSYLLEALERLHVRHELGNVRVLICGKGPLESELKAYVKKHHLSSVVTFVGFVTEAEKASYLATAHIAVLPSTGGESFGIVLLEAMAAGSQAVIAGDNMGYRSVMTERSEQLVDPRDIAAFTKMLRHYITSPRARQSAQKWQKEHVKQFDVRHVGQTLEAAYSRVVAKRARSRNN